MTDKYTIWCNDLFVPLDDKEKDELRNSLSEHELFFLKKTENGREGESAEILHRSEIAFGSPDPDAVLSSKLLKWVHLNTAGYTAFDHEYIKKELKSRGIILTNSSTVYDEPCAQHILSMILSLARKLLPALENQRGNKQWIMNELRSQLPLLNEQTVVILGFGAIAKRLTELLKPLKMNMIGMRRKERGDESIKIVTESMLDEVLPLADHLVNILPAHEETHQYLDERKLGLLKRGAIVYNIGRGTTIDQDALMGKLNSGYIAAAYLDVTDPEPLPIDHPLWITQNCYITPHTGGGHTTEKQRQLTHFLNNLRRLENNEELIDRII